MNSLDKIKADYKKGNMSIHDIAWLIEQVETLQEWSIAYSTLEKRVLQAERTKNELLMELRKLKTKKWYAVYLENLEMAMEINALKQEREDYKAAFESLRVATSDRR